MKRVNLTFKRIIISGLFVFLFILCLVPDPLKAQQTLHTREMSVSQAVNKKDFFKSPVLRAFKGLKPEEVIRIYKAGAAQGDKWLKDEGKPYSSFKQFFVRILYWFTMMKEGPDATMSVLAPFFLLFFLVSVLPFAFKALFVPPNMENPRRPDNDNIKHRWFRRRKKKQLNEVDEDDNYEEEDEEVEEDEEAGDDEETYEGESYDEEDRS